ncbi:PREDICTED: Down syndrome cell adhesion molecule-like [Ceratosolen solmsi marchali]|uniref:Down syndrome cell adhesion molecule-like n=1 Tax=Ceratosolen solmsi marchali TaxID=326594 RepID=A0AAJ7DTG6_9HYME|nr:PREDICTED: Down syndrome cell adhesion molecule-like [Ceratosolen solmsi marchali]
MSINGDNYFDDEIISRSKKNLVKRLKLIWYNRNNSDLELLNYQDIPGPISSEPIVIDGGRNWLSLSWEKADQRGPVPVVAYRVDAWQMGREGGARWKELGITPINSFDAFNLRPGGEYKFRVTPKNRYGWGESVTMSGTATVCDDVEIPEFTKILPGQLKALEGSTVELECEVRSDSKFDVKWLRETTEIDSSDDSKYIVKSDKAKCSLILQNINNYDSGRYICEVTNKAGKVSSYGRILVVNDQKILNADERLKKRYDTYCL